MSDTSLHNNSNAAGPEDPIVPIDFTPAATGAKRFRFRLSPARILITSVLLVFATLGWFILTAKSVFIDVDPVNSDISIASPMALKIGPRYLMREGEADIIIRAEGYYDHESRLIIESDQDQSFRIELTRLPGFLNLISNVTEATVTVDGEERGLTTPLIRAELAAGDHVLTITKERYQPVTVPVNIEGRSTEQALTVDLLPAWADVSFTSAPLGATVYVDGEDRGLTPLTTEILEGEHDVMVKLVAHKAWTDEVEVVALQDFSIPPIELEAADGLVFLQTSPSNAGVMLDGSYRGQTPLEITVTPSEPHQLTFFRNGYQEAQRSVRIDPDQETSLNITLDPILSSVEIQAQPENAELYINGEFMGNANQTIDLLAASQEIEIRAEGFVPYQTSFISRPGLEQKLQVSLKSLEQQRLESIKPQITNAVGQTLKLLYPSSFTMGASRREAGRQANEVLRDVTLTRPFYLSLTEVTNAQFAQFDSQHSSGVVEGQRITLSNNSQPVVRVSWEQAALFCNWLSEQESLTPFYRVENDSVVGFNRESSGYRLPTEAEWAWAARIDGNPGNLLKFPWGAELPPPENHGNYADISTASILGRIIANYNDSFVATAPVASFPPNSNGFYDMGGNVAEWTHDFYGASGLIGGNAETDPMGPESGSYHVIRGAGWAHGTVTELRLSFRDYGDEPRDDVGFRVARLLDLSE